jgi:SAM-dependent methyltransferase
MLPSLDAKTEIPVKNENPVNVIEELYTSGEYLKRNPDWHVGESPWKVRELMRMMARNKIAPRTICEIGCGAGEVLRLLQKELDSECAFFGYDISPKAIEMSKGKENGRLHFKLGDITEEDHAHFDLILVLDVLEHMENYFAFLKEIKAKSQYKIFHVPLDISVRSVLFGHVIRYREMYGHIHYFTKEIALRTFEDLGYEVLDYFYTIERVPIPWTELRGTPRILVRRILGKIKRGILEMPNALLSTINEDLGERIFGDRRLLILAK